ncbi:MAG: type I-E CRISPR-associated protein Cas6/Cse3/CasE [Acidobacteriia bacterium]|nr:type I-E CRISPR-associated protein Cas6/Cse3/CasE [Terriglobia bacterium]
MIWLSLLELNPRSRAVRNDLGDCNGLHRALMRLFPAADQPSARNALGVLYRLDQGKAGMVRVLLQSLDRPDFARLPEGYLETPPQSKTLGSIDVLLQPGRKLLFRLRANPTRAIDTKTRPDGTKSNGKRVELRGEEACMGWLHRKAGQHGFRILACRIDAGAPDPRRVNGKVEGLKGGSRITVASVLFDGILEVLDAALLREALQTGIGRAKSYGQGLLSLAPAREPDVPK